MPSTNVAKLPRYATTLAVKAWHWLDNPMSVPPALVDQRGLRWGLQRLRLWQSPSGFCDIEPHSLTVFYPFEESAAPILRRTEWQRSQDLERCPAILDVGGKDVDPTIMVRDVFLDKTRLEEILETAMALRIPLCWSWQNDRRSVTSGVGEVGFEFYDLAEPQARLRLEWSADVPPGWNPVIEWYTELLDWLEGCLGDNTT